MKQADTPPPTSAADRRGRPAAWGRGVAVSAVLSAVLAASAPTPAVRVEVPQTAGAFLTSALCVSGSDRVQATPAQRKRARRKQWAQLHRGGEASESDTERMTPDEHADGR